MANGRNRDRNVLALPPRVLAQAQMMAQEADLKQIAEDKEMAEKKKAFEDDVEVNCVYVAIAGLAPTVVYADSIKIEPRGFHGKSPVTDGDTAFAFSGIAALTIITARASDKTREVYERLVNCWLKFPPA